MVVSTHRTCFLPSLGMTLMYSLGVSYGRLFETRVGRSWNQASNHWNWTVGRTHVHQVALFFWWSVHYTFLTYVNKIFDLLMELFISSSIRLLEHFRKVSFAKWPFTSSFCLHIFWKSLCTELSKPTHPTIVYISDIFVDQNKKTYADLGFKRYTFLICDFFQIP